MSDDDRRKTSAALLKSGFPFQTAIEQVVRGLAGWRLKESEWPWFDTRTGDQALDMVAATRQRETQQLVLLIECKKSREDSLVFLSPGDSELTDSDEMVWCLRAALQDGRAKLTRYERWRLTPGSARSAFCVSTRQHNRLLEVDARSLIKATNAYARSDRAAVEKLASGPGGLPLYVPVLVTTERLSVVEYDPADVDLSTGEFPKASIPTANPVPWIRFEKSFLSGEDRGIGHRTVFVVHGPSFRDFLELVGSQGSHPSDFRSVMT